MYRVTDVKRVLVVGAGTMGSQIALQTAMSGRYDVTLVDSVEGQLERALAQNTRLLDRAVEKGRITRDDDFSECEGALDDKYREE